MTEEREHKPTHLFTVRLWIERHADHQESVRGRVEHVLSRDTRYVGSLYDLSVYLEAKLRQLDTTDSE